MNTQNLEINKDSYVAFDATSLRDLIISRLNRDRVFTDQNYISSNISSIIEIISYSFSTLMYYLNKTATESMFTEAQLYENINRIVKALGYNPMGCQTASVSFSLSATNIPIGNYIIPRYSYINIGDSAYSFNRDTAFSKKTTTIESVLSEDSVYRLYQGRFTQYPSYEGLGSDNEVVVLAVDDNTIIDHFNIDVYVQDNISSVYSQWERTDSLFNHSSRDMVYEIRLNENKRYEIKFGNNINGKKINEGDIITIYYISSSGEAGELGSNSFTGTFVSKYNSQEYNKILQDTSTQNLNYLQDVYFRRLIVNNNLPSTFFATYESVDDIKNRANKFYKSQNRLVTELDYYNFIKSNYNNIIADVSVKNNQEYMQTYIKYFYDIGISTPHLEVRALYNQLKFADACNFNNIYIFALPQSSGQTYLMPSQKETIINSIAKYKTITSDIVIVDPVYVGFDIAVQSTSNITLYEDINNTHIYITIDDLNRRSSESIKTDIKNIFLKTFNSISSVLGSTINVYQMYTDILNIDGVSRVYCKHNKTNAIVEGLSFILWNPVYPELDKTISTQNIILPHFKCVYLNNLQNIIKRIKFINNNSAFQSVNI